MNNYIKSKLNEYKPITIYMLEEEEVASCDKMVIQIIYNIVENSIIETFETLKLIDMEFFVLEALEEIIPSHLIYLDIVTEKSITNLKSLAIIKTKEDIECIKILIKSIIKLICKEILISAVCDFDESSNKINNIYAAYLDDDGFDFDIDESYMCGKENCIKEECNAWNGNCML